MIWRNMLPPFSGLKWVWSGNTDMLHGRWSFRSMRIPINWFWLIFWCISQFATTAMRAQRTFLASQWQSCRIVQGCRPFHVELTFKAQTYKTLVIWFISIILTHILPIHNSSCKVTWFLLLTQFIIIIQKPYIRQNIHSPLTCAAHKMVAKNTIRKKKDL